jgi:hypothetical protein
MGRKSTYTREVADFICEQVSEGKTLKEVCREHAERVKITEGGVRGWVIDDVDGFASRYARARQLQIEAMADELNEIADDGRNDFVATNDPENPGYKTNGEVVNRSRLRVDTRKWLLSKLVKAYMDRQEIEVTDNTAAAIIAARKRGA